MVTVDGPVPKWRYTLAFELERARKRLEDDVDAFCGHETRLACRLVAHRDDPRGIDHPSVYHTWMESMAARCNAARSTEHVRMQKTAVKILKCSRLASLICMYQEVRTRVVEAMYRTLEECGSWSIGPHGSSLKCQNLVGQRWCKLNRRVRA